MAGHSKWSNIKHRKGAQDKRRAQLFTKLAKEVTIAAKEGGKDVNFNPRLRLALDKAKKQSMPKDNIDRAIKKGTGELAGVEYLEIRYGKFWRELPDQKTKDKYASHGEFIDLDIDYKNYIH